MVYGSILRESTETSMTVEQFLEFQSDVQEILLKICVESCEEDDESEFVEEGANLDYRAAFKKASKTVKENIREATKAQKAGDISKAKKKLKEANKALDEAEKIIKETDSTVGSVIFGYFANNLLFMVEAALPLTMYVGGIGAHTAIANSAIKSIVSGGKIASSTVTASKIAAGVTTAGWVLTALMSIIDLVKGLVQFIDDIKDSDTTTTQAINLYRNRLLRYIKDLRRSIKMVEVQM